MPVSACNFIKKETLTQVFSCEFCAIANNTFFYRTFPCDYFSKQQELRSSLVTLYSHDAYPNNETKKKIQKLPSEVFYKKGVLENLAKFTGKQLIQRFFLNNVTNLRPATSFEKRLWYRCFPVNFPKALRTIFLNNTSERLLLKNQVQWFKSCCTAK